jgi:hypothetical protein
MLKPLSMTGRAPNGDLLQVGTLAGPRDFTSGVCPVIHS